MIKNVLGELVTSQIYVSTLTAGEFTATQKILIRKYVLVRFP